MKKSDIIDLMETTIGNREQARKAVDAMLEGITQALKNGETISIRNLGTFKCVQRKARQGVNPRTGEKIKIKARRAVRFSPGSKLQQAVN
jgi:nucleoid DNA-binding protein